MRSGAGILPSCPQATLEQGGGLRPPASARNWKSKEHSACGCFVSLDFAHSPAHAWMFLVPNSGSHAAGSQFFWLSQRTEWVPAWLLGLIPQYRPNFLLVKAFGVADTAPPQTAPHEPLCTPEIPYVEWDALVTAPRFVLAWVDVPGLGFHLSWDAATRGCSLLCDSSTLHG